jgi:DNA polymerase
VQRTTEHFTSELQGITGGAVQSVGELAKITAWLATQGVHAGSLESDAVDSLLERDLPPAARRVLEIRSALGSASVKKLFAIERRLTSDGRLHDLFAFCGADRTGRWAGRGPQPQNLPGGKPVDQVDEVLAGIADRPPALDVIADVSGCLRGLFVAAPGHDLICSDFSAIEAVVLAELAGETWRQEVFRTHGKIYETSAGLLTGNTLEFYAQYKLENGAHHPDRKKGKVSELASGYGGGLGAWKAFGADAFMTDDEIRSAVTAWRAASPNITALWYGVQDAAFAAITNPGYCYSFRGISYGVAGDVLYCQLPSGRRLTYHNPRIYQKMMPWGKETTCITYMGWNSNYLNGPVGWMRLGTYGPKLVENLVQAVSRDILAHAMTNLDAAGYPIVLHVHDEVVAEVPKGQGSIENFEQIMGQMPAWASGWPVRAAGGWRGLRYRKE